MSSQDPLSELLGITFDNLTDVQQSDREKHRRDFVFHMLDWMDDLKELSALYAAPERYSREEAENVVQAFLMHATSHIMAAARLANVFHDIFGNSE